MKYILDGKFGRYNGYLQFSFCLVIYVRYALIRTCAYVLPTLYELVYVKWYIQTDTMYQQNTNSYKQIPTYHLWSSSKNN